MVLVKKFWALLLITGVLISLLLVYFANTHEYLRPYAVGYSIFLSIATLVAVVIHLISNITKDEDV